MKNFTINNRLKKLLIILFWFGVWQLAAVIIDQPLYLPSVPLSVKSLVLIFGEADFWLNIGATLLRVLISLLFSISLGIILSIISSRIKLIEMALSPLLSTIKSIPTMSIIILALVWLKTGNVPIFVSFLLCFPIVYTNTLNGIKNINKKHLELCTIYKIPLKRKLAGVIIPSVKSSIQSAIMVCIGFSWKATIAAEVLSAPSKSMGYQLYQTKLYLDTPSLFAWTIVVVTFSVVIEKVVKRLFNNDIQKNEA